MKTGIVTEPRQNVVNPMPYKTCEFSLLIHSFTNVYSIGLCMYNKNLYMNLQSPDKLVTSLSLTFFLYKSEDSNYIL